MQQVQKLHQVEICYVASSNSTTEINILSLDATPSMLLKGHSVLMATLDYLMVAQCASLLHKMIIVGQDLLQLPWVRGVLLSSKLLRIYL